MSFVGGMQNMMNSSDANGATRPGDLGMNLTSNPNSGFFTTAAGGFNGVFTVSPKTQITTNYFYNYLQKDITREAWKQTILDENSYTTVDSGGQRDKNQNHRATVALKQDLDSLTRLTLRVTFANSNTVSRVNNLTSSSQIGGIENLADQHYFTTGGQNDINNALNLMHRFRKLGRSLTLNGTFRYTPQDKDASLKSINEFSTSDSTFSLVDTVNQNQVQAQQLVSFSGRVGYTEPFGKRHAVEAYLGYQENDNSLVKDFFDLDADGFNPTRNPILSNNYKTAFRYENAGLNWRFFTKNLNMTTGLAVQNSELTGEIFTTNTLIAKRFFNVLPSFRVRYNLGKSRSLRVNYSTRVNEPTVTQLSPVADNSNPLNISLGNPDLRAEYSHNLRIHYNLFDQFSFASFFAAVNGSYTRNKISQMTTVDSLLRQVTQPVNVDNDLLVNTFLSASAPIRKLKIKFTANLNSSIGRSIVFINGTENFVNRFTNGGDLKIENKKKDHFDAYVGGRISHTLTNYPSSPTLNQSYLNSGLISEVSVFLPKNFIVMTGLDYSVYSGGGFNGQQSVPLWRAAISKKIFKNSRGTIKIAAFDLLNRNIGINRTTQINYLQEERVNTLSRYFLGSFSYSIVSVGNKR
jgi:hypothetical protein